MVIRSAGDVWHVGLTACPVRTTGTGVQRACARATHAYRPNVLIGRTSKEDCHEQCHGNDQRQPPHPDRRCRARCGRPGHGGRGRRRLRRRERSGRLGCRRQRHRFRHPAWLWRGCHGHPDGRHRQWHGHRRRDRGCRRDPRARWPCHQRDAGADHLDRLDRHRHGGRCNRDLERHHGRLGHRVQRGHGHLGLDVRQDGSGQVHRRGQGLLADLGPAGHHHRQRDGDPQDRGAR